MRFRTILILYAFTDIHTIPPPPPDSRTATTPASYHCHTMVFTAHHHNDPALAQRLAHSGLRSTPQREIVYNVLLTQRDHPTADEIFARVKTELPGISLATVYNCLEALVAHDLVRAVHFERAPTRYCPHLQPHAHFHDEDTGHIHDIDLPPPLLAKLKALLPQGYSADTIDITFRGHATEKKPEGLKT